MSTSPNIFINKRINLFFCFSIICLVFNVTFAQRAAKFIGNENFVNVPYFSLFSEYSIEAWVNTTQTSTGTIISWKNHSQDADAVILRVNDGNLEFGEWINSSWRSIRSNKKINTGSWVHVAVSRVGSEAKLYINGMHDYTGTVTSSTTFTADNIRIGGISTNFNESFVGLIDDVRVWSKVLSQNEIYNNLFANLVSSTPNLQLNYPFENNFIDASSSQRNGSVTGTVSFVDANRNNLQNQINISEFTFSENHSNAPYLRFKVNTASTFYWALVDAMHQPLTRSDILTGSNVIEKGVEVITSNNVFNTFYLTSKLEVGKSYKIYAIAKNEFVSSPVFVSNEFNYSGLQILPDGWRGVEIGNTNLLGGTKFESGDFNVQASGADIWGHNDSFHFLSKEFSDSVEIVTQLKIQENTDNWAKAGLMLRSGLKSNSSFVMIAKTPSHGLQFVIRSDNGGFTKQIDLKPLNAESVWLKIAYKSNWIAVYYSLDGVNWTRMHYPRRFEFDGKFYGGIAVTSHNNNRICNTSFKLPEVKLSNFVVNTKGQYFSKKEYVELPLPIFSQVKTELPKPILEGNPAWVDMYWRAWEIGFSHIRKPQLGSNFVSNYYDEAFDNRIYQWDIIFMTMFGRYANNIFMAVNSLDNFYINQHDDGFINRMIDESNGQDARDEIGVAVNPPLFSWAEMESFQLTGDTARLRLVFPVLEKYYEWLEINRRCYNTNHQLYWSNGDASGMDNTPRDIHRPNTNWSTDEEGWIDMSSQMVIQCRNLSKISGILGFKDKEVAFENKAHEIAQKINTFLWNEQDGIYYDVNTLSVQTNHKTAASFWPMLAEVTSLDQEAKLIANLKDPKTFWRPNVFPTLAADHPHYNPTGCYWKGGVWAPTNYAIIKGLANKGYVEFAKESSERYLNALSEVFKKTNTLWELYAPELINGEFAPGTETNCNSICKPNFVGWTGLGPICMLIENVIGIKPDGLNKTITWDLSRVDKHGLENLRFADITTSLYCEKRISEDNPVLIKVVADKPYRLIVKIKGKEYILNVLVGDNYFSLDLLSTIDLLEVKTINLYPNPVSDVLNLKFDDNLKNPIIVDIYNMKGKKLVSKSIDSHNSSIDVSGLKPSTYLAKIKSKPTYAFKFIKK